MGIDTPLALYVHLQWCERKCPYCDFNSHPLRGQLPAEEYTNALLGDLHDALPLTDERVFDTVFFGGGTPSLFPADSIKTLLESLTSAKRLADQAEITLEANPGSAEAGRFLGYRDAGVNRLSIGVQSFNDEHLSLLGRIHSADQAHRACQAAHEAGFDNFNIDLMFGLPTQTPVEATDDLNAAISERPTHLSLYQLTIEPNTAFAAEPPELPSDDASWDIRCAVQERAQAAGFQHYEVSAFARPGRECHHNLNYWRFGDYLGIGAGAHSKLTLGSGIHRWHRPRHPKAYVESMAQPSTPQIGCALETADQTFEFLLNALRLKEGFHPKLFKQRTGMDWPFESDEVQGAIADGLLYCSSEQIRTTALGWRFLDELLQRFLKP